jgi:type IV secretory pathway protease TraF
MPKIEMSCRKAVFVAAFLVVCGVVIKFAIAQTNAPSLSLNAPASFPVDI